MKTNNQIKTICLVFLLGSQVSLQAQENQKTDKSSVNREMTLEREYDPTVQDANKVNTLPLIHEPTVTKRAIDYATFTSPAEPPKELNLLPSGSIMTQIESNKRRGYLNLGAGNYMNINGDFGYHILNNEIDKLNIYFTHRSTNGKVKYIRNDEKVKQKINDNLGGLDFKHRFELATLKLGANYGYSAFNYFGDPYHPKDDDIMDFVQATYDSETKQVNQTVGIHAGVESNEGAALGYLIGVDYTNFTQKYGYSTQYDGVKENKIRTDLGMNAAFGGNQLIGISAQFDYFNFSNPKDENNKVYSYTGDNHLEGTLSPYYRLEGDIWNLQLGANAMFITGENKKLFFSPNIALDVKATEQTVFYLKADGKIHSNTPYELSRINRYVSPIQAAAPSRTWFDGLVGLRSNAGSGFWFDVFAGYKATDDDAFFIPSLIEFGNVASIQQWDSKAIKAGASFKYNYSQMIAFYLKGSYTKWDIKGKFSYYNPASSTYPPQLSDFTDLKAYGRPDFELSTGVRLTPIEPLTFDLNYYLGTGRYTLLTSRPIKSQETDYMIPENTKLDNIHDVNVTGTWKFNDTFSVYAKINNLLFQKYDLNYGYPSQGLNAMVGFNVNF